MRVSGAKGSAEFELGGVTVFAPNTQKSYVSRQAVEIFKKQM